MIRWGGAAIIALGTIASSAASAEDLHLLCIGGGTANKQAVTRAYGANSEGDTAWADVTSDRSVGFEDQVNIDIVDGSGRIRMPRTMLPGFHGGKGGWMEIKNLKVGENEITGNAAVNFINSPKVRVDRLTGMLSISGSPATSPLDAAPMSPAKSNVPSDLSARC